jgi:hypothetical protein
VEIGSIEKCIEDGKHIHEDGDKKYHPPLHQLVFANGERIEKRYLRRDSTHSQQIHYNLY